MVRYFLCLVWLAAAGTTYSQDLAKHNWYFGSKGDGIRFNRATNVAQAITNQPILTPLGTGGSAVATDPATANLLFYTDGVNVYDATHLQMLGGGLLGGNSALNQPVAICPVPGQPNKYFIFVHTIANTITVSVVDMGKLGHATSQPGTGEFESQNALIPGLTNRTDGMIVVPHANGTDYWLITHTKKATTSEYTVTAITAASYTGTFTSVAPAHQEPIRIDASNFAYNHRFKKIAVSPESIQDNALILDFDPTNGNITFDRYINSSGVLSATTQTIYDIEWDPKDGRYLYLSRIGEAGIPADVLQYDYQLSSPTGSPTILNSIYTTPIARSYGLQVAPDSAIYHIYQPTLGGAFLVEKLTRTDTIASFVRKSQPFGITGFNGKQFPSFMPPTKVNLVVDFTSTATAVNGNCQNNPITFFPQVTPNADSLLWTFDVAGTPTRSKAWSPVHTFTNVTTNPQSFDVSLTAFYQGQQVSVTKPVSIKQFNLRIQLVQDTTACKCELPKNNGKAGCPNDTSDDFKVTVKVQSGSATSYVWSNKDLGDTLTPDSAGYYYVVVTDGTGCSTYAGVTVKEYGLTDQRRNVWYFGNKAGIDFNTTPPQALNKSVMDAPEGCSIVCDRNGQPIFYTNGDQVFDKTNTQIDSGIGGSINASQSALIVPVPGDETLYYIFTTQAINGTSLFEVRYSIFDLKENSGNGAITKKSVLLFSRSTERITSNGNWLIVHEYGNSTFRTYRITARGIGEPVYSDIGSIHSFLYKENGQGYMKLGVRNNLAVPICTPGVSNVIELFQLVDSTGVIINYRKLDMAQPNGQVYGVEFSPGGRRLFATIKGVPSATASEIYEYFVDSLDRTPPVFVQKVARPTLMGALQIAPTSEIYIAIDGQGQLGSIQANDDYIPTSSTFNFSATPALISPTISKLGLPNFIQQISNGFGGPGFTFTGTCIGGVTSFVGTRTDVIDEFQWSFGDGASSTIGSPQHTFGAPGTYKVAMRLTNRCGLDVTITQDVKINDLPPKPAIPASASLCGNQSVTLGPLPATFTYLWNDGTTGTSNTIFAPGLVSVTATDATTGCTNTATSTIGDGRPQFDLGAGAILCQNGVTSVTTGISPSAATHTWTTTFNGAPVANTNTGNTQIVDTSAPGVIKYSVNVKIPPPPNGNGCEATDDITFTISPSPSIVLTKILDPTCNLADGRVELKINSIGTGPYSYTLLQNTSLFAFQTDVVANTFTFNTVRAGTFEATVTDQVSNCSTRNSVNLSNSTFTASATNSDCNPAEVTVTTAGLTNGSLRYTFSPVGVPAVPGVNFFGPQASNIATLPIGSYSIAVQDNGGVGCTFTFSHIVPVNPVVPTVAIQSFLCSTPPLLRAVVTGGTGTQFKWTLPDATSVITPTADLDLTSAGRRSGTYSVEVTVSASCVLASQSITINFNGPLTANFIKSSECASDVRLTAAATGSNVTYRWFLNGVYQPALVGRVVVVQQSGDYSLKVDDLSNNCTQNSANLNVQVVGTLSVSFDNFQTPCEDGSSFTLSTTASTTGVTYAWALNNSVITGQTNSTLTDTREGTYKVTITKSNCPASATIQVLRAPLPQGLLPTSGFICNDPQNLDPLTNKKDLDPGLFTSYKWSEATLGSLNYTNRVYTATEPGTYIVEITNAFNCKNTDQTELVLLCIPTIVGPNAFRPNSKVSDNQQFSVVSFFITNNFEIAIYNRWGELVFQSKDRYFKWNGGYNNNPGQPAPGGTYSYVIRYESLYRPEEGIKEQRGGLVLLR